MKKSIIIAIITIIVILLGVSAYFILNRGPGRDFRFDRNFDGFPNGSFNRSMQMDNQTIEEVKNVFDTSDEEGISSYCQENLQSCFYYCREINPDQEYCKTMLQDFQDRRPR